MASKTRIILVTLLSILSLLAYSSVNAQLSPNFYATTCPNLRTLVQNAMRQAVTKEARMGASILRMFFHDCFVNVRHRDMHAICVPLCFKQSLIAYVRKEYNLL